MKSFPYIRQEPNTAYCQLTAQLNALRFFGAATPEVGSMEFSLLIAGTGCAYGPMTMRKARLAKWLGLRLYPLKVWQNTTKNPPALLDVYVRGNIYHQVLVICGDQDHARLVGFDPAALEDPLVEDMAWDDIYVPFYRDPPEMAKRKEARKRLARVSLRKRKKRPKSPKSRKKRGAVQVARRAVTPPPAYRIVRVGDPDWTGLIRHCQDFVEGKK